jgi:predicted AAA+ superfamily ATPase
LFENLVIAELLKFRFNEGKRPNLYFWRDKSGHEIDCIYEVAQQLLPIEIKSSKSLSTDHFKSLAYFQKLSQQPGGILCYAGDIETNQRSVSVVNWKHLVKTLQAI